MKKGRFNDMKSITVLMFIITFLLWVVLLMIKWMVWGIEPRELYNDFISNMLGILPPIIIFNFVYEYLTKKHMADEMAEEITKTLLSNPEAISGFDHETKKRFINTTIDTMVGAEYSDMVYTLLDPYLTYQYDVRRFFKYTITIRDYKNHPQFTSDNYMKVYENLKYKKTYHNEDKLPGEVAICFFVDNYKVDKELRQNNYLFRENLKWNKSEMEWFLGLSREEQEEFVKKEMAVSLFIDNEMCSIFNLQVSEYGICICFSSGHTKTEDHSHSVEISFAMPQRKGHSEIQVCISEPTYSPVIQFSFPEDTMQVESFSFMNEGDDSSVERATRCIGGYEYCVQDKWIYPMSGVVFVIDDK